MPGQGNDDPHMSHGHHDMQHGNHSHHDGHAGHGDHIGQFRRLFWVNLVLAVPVVVFSPMFAMLLGYSVPAWTEWVAAVFGTVMYAWGGRPFLSGAVSELKTRQIGRAHV